MRILSYRNKKAAKTILIILGVLLLAILVFVLCRFIYIQRYLVYSPDGVQLNYSQDLTSDRESHANRPSEEYPVTILSPEQSEEVSAQVDGELRPLNGYYISTTMLQNVPRTLDALSEQKDIHTVMIEMKSIFGNFYYDTSIPGTFAANADIPAIEAMIADLASQKDVYLIANVPAFTDNNYALDHQSQALPLSSGALWMNSNNCYWLDPAQEDVQDYLITIADELTALGFHEVVFTNFYFPDSQNIIYNREYTREDAILQAAESIDRALDKLPVRVSFQSSLTDLAAYTDRVYLQADSGSSVAALVEPFEDVLNNPAAQIVFLTASRDTRFRDYSILRPLIEDDNK